MENSLERVEKLLAQILVRQMLDASVGEQALALSRAGFLPAEIGALVGARPNTISVQLLRARRSKKSTRRKKGK